MIELLTKPLTYEFMQRGMIAAILVGIVCAVLVCIRPMKICIALFFNEMIDIAVGAAPSKRNRKPRPACGC